MNEYRVKGELARTLADGLTNLVTCEGAMNAGAEQLNELEGVFESVAEATEQLLGEYALFVLEHEEVTAFLQGYLATLKYDFERALQSADNLEANKILDKVQLLFGEAQLRVNRGVIPSPESISYASLSKTGF